MSVYQVEEYYIYIEWSDHLSPCAQASLTSFLDCEFGVGYFLEAKNLTIEGFGSEDEAMEREVVVSEWLRGNLK